MNLHAVDYQKFPKMRMNATHRRISQRQQSQSSGDQYHAFQA
jgi:hypothetical protein